MNQETNPGEVVYVNQNNFYTGFLTLIKKLFML